jgi:hypothetical protein
MRATFAILICCLYTLSAVEATPSSKSESAEVQQGIAKAASPLKFWSDDKSSDDGKDAKDDKDDKDDNDEFASRSVAVLIGTSTYVIPCFQGDSIVNLNGLIPTPEASSSAVSSSAVDSSSSAASSSAPSSSSASSSEVSSATDITTTTDSINTTTGTTTSADSVPTFAVTLYTSFNCMGAPVTTSYNSGCFRYDFPLRVSVGTSSDVALTVRFFEVIECTGIPVAEAQLGPSNCSQYLDFGDLQPTSYSVMFTV